MTSTLRRRGAIHGPATAALALVAALTTPVPAQTVFQETFDDPGAATPNGPANLVAAGWQFRFQQGAAAAATWRTGDNQDFTPFSWPSFLTIEALPVAGQPAAAWAILPPIAGTAAGQQVFFGHHPWLDPIFFGTVDHWELHWSPTGGTSTGSGWTDVGDFTVPIPLTITNPGTAAGWLAASGSLPGAGGRLALRYEYDTWYGGTTPRAAVDDVRLIDSQAVPLPSPGQTVHWTAAMSPITVLDIKRVPPTATLVVDAGVEIRFGTLTGALRIEGDLHIEGTAGNPVLLRLLPGEDVNVRRVHVGFTDYTSTAMLAPARARLQHVDADVLVFTEHGASLALDAVHFHQPPGLISRYAGVRASESTVTVRRCRFTNGQLEIAESYLHIDRTTFDNALLASTRRMAGSTMHIDHVKAVDYVPGQTIYGSAPISLFGSDHWLGADNVIAHNPLPVTLRGGGLARGSVVPASGNGENVVEFVDGTANGVITLADPGVPYVWRQAPSATGLDGIVEVQPGVTIRFAPGAGVLVNGTAQFRAWGRPDAPIRLAAHVPGAPWDGVAFLSNSRRSKLESCIVEGAAIGVAAQQSVVRLADCWLRDNTIAANAASNSSIRSGKSVFTRNGTGVRITSTSGADVDGDTDPNWFERNGTAVQDLGAQFAPRARNNYWGHASGPQHPSNPGGIGDAVVGGNVLVQPFRATPPDLGDHPPVVRFEPINSFLAPGVQMILHWTATDDRRIVEHRLEYTPHGENPPLAPFLTGIPGSARSVQVTIPAPVPSSNLNPPAFRIVAIDDAGQEGYSDVWFYHQLRGTSPFQMTTDLSRGLTVGQQFTLDWTGVGGSVTMVFEDLRTFAPIGIGAPVSVIQNRVPPVSTDLARYLVFDPGQDRYYYSDYFEVRPEGLTDDRPPAIKLVSPRPGDVYHGSGTVRIGWRAHDDERLRSFDIQASYDGGDTWHSVVRELDGTRRQYHWQLPPSTGIADARVRVIARDERFQASSAGSDVVFSILP